jgi:hypothetical protein
LLSLKRSRKQKDQVRDYQIDLPSHYSRSGEGGALISKKLEQFELLHQAELQAALRRKLARLEEFLEAITHNLRRSEELYRQVLADRARMLELLMALERENAALHRRLGRVGGKDERAQS